MTEVLGRWASRVGVLLGWTLTYGSVGFVPVQMDDPTTLAPEKPLLRGWLHLGMAPLMLLAGLTLIVVAPTLPARVGCAIYVLSSLALFGNSAVYHRGHWSIKVSTILRRIDHANIFVFIAGTYTPLTIVMLSGRDRIVLLSVIWSVALAGVIFKVCWLNAPRILYTALYIAMGWVAVFWLPDFWRAGGPAVVILIGAGGLAYTIGALIYALKWPNPSPSYFGYHEIFHACTIAAAICHFIAIVMVVV